MQINPDLIAEYPPVKDIVIAVLFIKNFINENFNEECMEKFKRECISYSCENYYWEPRADSKDIDVKLGDEDDANVLINETLPSEKKVTYIFYYNHKTDSLSEIAGGTYQKFIELAKENNFEVSYRLFYIETMSLEDIQNSWQPDEVEIIKYNEFLRKCDEYNGGRLLIFKRDDKTN